MATSLDFSRAVNLNIKATAGRKFDAVLTFTRDDSGSVDWTAKTLNFKVYDKFNGTAMVNWAGGTGFAISTDTITFNQVFENEITEVDLEKGIYYFEFYNLTDLQTIAYGKVELI